MANVFTELEFIIMYSLLSLFIIWVLLITSVLFFYSDCAPWPPLAAHDFELCMDQLSKEIPLPSLIMACWKSTTILIIIWRFVGEQYQPYLVHPSLIIRQDSSPSASLSEERRANTIKQTRRCRRTCQWISPGIYRPVH